MSCGDNNKDCQSWKGVGSTALKRSTTRRVLFHPWKLKQAQRTEAVKCDFTICGFCPPVPDSDDILLESVVKRRCRLPRASFGED